MRSFVFISLLAAVPVASLPSLAADAPAGGEAKLDPKAVEFFEKSIRPVLVDKCYSCHSEAAGKAKGGLLLDSRDALKRGGGSGPVIVPGKPEESLFFKAINYAPDIQMPPAGKLSDAQIAAFKAWIQMGAPDPRDKAPEGKGKPVLSGLTAKARSWWAFQPIKKQEVPDVSHITADAEWKAWGKNPVDRFIMARLDAVRIRPNPSASKETLIRRVSYDLTGLPPTPMEVRNFLNDKSPDAWERLVDRLLASPRYGERWGRHWLDSARYADTRGNLENNGRNKYEDYRFAYAWTYRDYVINSFNEDKPYNQFLVEQLAADRLPDIKPGDGRLAALGFITVGKRFDNNDDTIDERIDTVTKATMGLTVSCARCHDHKFDPIPTADYYALHGVFQSLDEPYDKPELHYVSDDPEKDQRQKVEFALKLAELEAENRKAIYGILRDRLTQFQNKSEGYLMVAVTPGRDPMRADYERKYGINPDRDREIFNSLRVNADHPVLGPFAQVSRLQKDTFAERYAEMMPKILANTKRPVNPLVADMLKELKPRTLVDVAIAYAELFARAKVETGPYFEARSTPGRPEPKVDKAMEQVINTPYFIPAADDIATVGKQYEYFTSRKLLKEGWQQAIDVEESQGRLKFAAINTLRLADRGTVPSAMVIHDSPNPRDSFIFIRGERFRKGPDVPRRFLEVIAGPKATPFKEGSGRLELAKAIVDPKNPLTPRVIVNRVWMHHFGEGFVPSPDDLGTMSQPPSNQALMDYLATWFMDNGWSMKKLHKLILMSQAYQQSGASRFEGEERDPDNRLLWRANLRRLNFEAIRDSMLQLTGKLDTKMGGSPVNITDEPFSYRRSVYGYVDRANLSDLMSQFDFSDPEMPNSKRISTIVPQQSLFFMNNPLAIDVARQIMARPEVANAEGEERVQAIYQVLFQRKPREQEIQLAADFIGAAESLVAKRESLSSSTKGTAKPGQNAAKPKPNIPQLAKNNNKPGMGGMNGGMNGETSTMASMNDSQAMKAMMGNKFAALKNDGETIERKPLTPWELYCQSLIFSNEFVYVG